MYVTNFKLAALGLLEILRFELFILDDIFVYNGRVFPEPVTNEVLAGSQLT